MRGPYARQSAPARGHRPQPAGPLPRRGRPKQRRGRPKQRRGRPKQRRARRQRPRQPAGLRQQARDRQRQPPDRQARGLSRRSLARPAASDRQADRPGRPRRDPGRPGQVRVPPAPLAPLLPPGPGRAHQAGQPPPQLVRRAMVRGPRRRGRAHRAHRPASQARRGPCRRRGPGPPSRRRPSSGPPGPTLEADGLTTQDHEGRAPDATRPAGETRTRAESTPGTREAATCRR